MIKIIINKEIDKSLENYHLNLFIVFATDYLSIKGIMLLYCWMTICFKLIELETTTVYKE